MIKTLKELANKLPEGQEKSELLAKIEELEKANLISKPKSLEELLKSEEFADLKSQYDAALGSYRTKWEKEFEEKMKKQDPQKEPKNAEEQLFQKFNELTETFSKKFDDLTNTVTSLQTEKKVEELKGYLASKLKGLPEEFSGLISVAPDMTTADIDKKIELLTTAKEKLLKDIDTSPYTGKPKSAEGNLNEWKEALPIKEKKND